MKNLLFFILAILCLFFLSPSSVFAQMGGFPSADETPFSSKARGFVSTHLGLTYLPVFEMTIAHQTEDTYYHNVRNLRTKPPGIAAGLGFIPVFSMNGIMLEAAYALSGAEFKADLYHEGETYTTETTLGLTTVDVSLGYVRYFLDGPWRIYFGAKGGLQVVTVKAITQIPSEEQTSRQKQINNASSGGFFGFFHEVAAGGIGAEARIDGTFMESRAGLKDTFGNSDVVIYHPLTIRLMAVFLLGRL